MNFRIEQIAIYPPDPKAAIALLTAIGLHEWAHDIVVAEGLVNEAKEQTNVAALAFNYQAAPDNGKLEFEVLHYRAGRHWMQSHEPSASHLGMHCTSTELYQWRQFFRNRGIMVAQEVETQSHTNPVIAGKRSYTYVIFSTRHILGIDLKFIVRKDVKPPRDYEGTDGGKLPVRSTDLPHLDAALKDA